VRRRDELLLAHVRRAEQEASLLVPRMGRERQREALERLDRVVPLPCPERGLPFPEQLIGVEPCEPRSIRGGTGRYHDEERGCSRGPERSHTSVSSGRNAPCSHLPYGCSTLTRRRAPCSIDVL